MAQAVDLLVDARSPSRCRCRCAGCRPRAGSSRSRRRSTPPRSRGRTLGTPRRAGRRGSCWARCTRVGRWSWSMTWATVKVLPEPVTPSRVWSRLPWRRLSTSPAIACGWSPAGWKSEVSWNWGTPASLRLGLPGPGPSAVGSPPARQRRSTSVSSAVSRPSSARSGGVGAASPGAPRISTASRSEPSPARNDHGASAMNSSRIPVAATRASSARTASRSAPRSWRT